jgi:hypothetical protein
MQLLARLDRHTIWNHFGALAVLVCVTIALAIVGMRTPVAHRCHCPYAQHRTDPRVVADHQYRAKDFNSAATTLQDAITRGLFDRELADELLVVASFYEQLGRQYAIALDPVTPLQEALVALRWATQLDLMLGGAHQDELGILAKVDDDHGTLSKLISDP